MKANPRFANKSQGFWGIIKLISQNRHYTIAGEVRKFSFEEIEEFLNSENLNIADSETIEELAAYLAYRADSLNKTVQNDLMDGKAAQKLFSSLKRTNKPTCPIPLNKQKGEKRT